MVPSVNVPGGTGFHPSGALCVPERRCQGIRDKEERSGAAAESHPPVTCFIRVAAQECSSVLRGFSHVQHLGRAGTRSTGCFCRCRRKKKRRSCWHRRGDTMLRNEHFLFWYDVVFGTLHNFFRDIRSWK